MNGSMGCNPQMTQVWLDATNEMTSCMVYYYLDSCFSCLPLYDWLRFVVPFQYEEGLRWHIKMVNMNRVTSSFS